MTILRFDGGSQPNPGKCAGAYAIFVRGQEVVAEGGTYIPHGTNNIGEYTGLLAGLKKCISLGIKDLYVEGDSLLVISQITMKWKVKKPELHAIYIEIVDLIKSFEKIEFHHIRREYNDYADKLSDLTIEKQETWEKEYKSRV